MDKHEVLQHMKDSLVELKSSMQQMQKDVATISECIGMDMIIPTEASQNVIDNLTKINALNAFYRENYAMLSGTNFDIKTISDFAASLNQIEDDLKYQEYIDNARMFFKLSSNDDNVKHMLNIEKVKLTSLLESGNAKTEMLGLVKPYFDFVEALKETNMINIVKQIPILSTYFGDEIVAHALLNKNVYVLGDNGTEKTESIPVETVAVDTQPAVEKAPEAAPTPIATPQPTAAAAPAPQPEQAKPRDNFVNQLWRL